MSESKWEQIERERDKPMREILQEVFEREQSIEGVASDLDVSRSTVWLWINMARLQKRMVLEPIEVAS